MDTQNTEKWRIAGEARIAAQLEAGELIRPDMANPAHQRLVGMATRQGTIHGLQPKIYLVPVRGDTPEEQRRSEQQTLGAFEALGLNEALIIPESADSLLTPDEAGAVLAHEFDHLCNTSLLVEKTSLLEQFNAAHTEFRRAEHQNAPAPVLEELQATRDRLFEQASGASTRFEQAADENVVAQGRASDLGSALQKIMFARYIGEHAHEHPTEQAIEYCNAHEQIQRNENPVASAGHTRESFVERLARLEKAAQQQEAGGHSR